MRDCHRHQKHRRKIRETPVYQSHLPIRADLLMLQAPRQAYEVGLQSLCDLV